MFSRSVVPARPVRNAPRQVVPHLLGQASAIAGQQP
jgi:hypothetical protein